MPSKPPEIGDFGLPRRPIQREQVVGIFDLVGFTDLDSNRELVQAVTTLETQIQLMFEPKYYWDERTKGGKEKETNNLLLRSTGDGYIVAFSRNIDDLAALQDLTEVHNAIRQHHPVKLGVNKGQNYIVSDVNDRVNIVGWGINLAARALHFAESNQIICTSHLAEPIKNTHGEFTKSLTEIGSRVVKNATLTLYNYYKKSEFGAQLTPGQRGS